MTWTLIDGEQISVEQVSALEEKKIMEMLNSIISNIGSVCFFSVFQFYYLLNKLKDKRNSASVGCEFQGEKRIQNEDQTYQLETPLRYTEGSSSSHHKL